MLVHSFIYIDGDLDMFITLGNFYNKLSHYITSADVDPLYEFFLKDKFMGDIVFYWDSTKIPPHSSSISYLQKHSNIDITYLLKDTKI